MIMEPGAEKNGIWTETFRVRSSEADAMQCATLESLCLYFQEAAWNHAESLGVGFSHLQAQGRLWVLSRLALEVEQSPRWGDIIQVMTWPRRIESIFALRDFEIRNDQDQRLVAGASAWLVLNSETRRPQRLDKLLSHIQGLPAKMALGSNPEKLPESTCPPEGVGFHVHYSDLDANNHVNNSRYIRWITGSYPAAFLQTHRPLRLEVNFLGETRAGDDISVRSLEKDPTDFHHYVVKTNNAESVCQASLQWKPRFE